MNPSLFPTAHRPDSIVDTLAAWRELAPEQVALTILRDGEEIERTATYRRKLTQRWLRS